MNEQIKETKVHVFDISKPEKVEYAYLQKGLFF